VEVSKEVYLKIVLVLFALLVKVSPTMKRIFGLIVLLGFVMGTVLTGCEKPAQNTTAPDTNAAPTAPTAPPMPASTNK
jgi:hypothetical protein